MKTMISSLTVALVFCLGSFAVAQDEQSEGKTCANCPSASCADSGTCCKSSSECGSECPMTAAMKKLPAMTYKVGDKAVCCSESAAAMANEQEKPMHYVVGDKEFEDKTEAYTALVVATENFVEKFITPCKCETSGKTTIAGQSCNCPVEAGKNAELVKKAVDEVKMKYVVGNKECMCPNEAKAIASESENKTTYVVAGKETCCSLEARMNLAKAKYMAAIKALASTDKQAETATSKAS